MVYGLKFPLSCFDPFDKKVLTKFHNGDIVIGNKYAAQYNITKPGILGVVEEDYGTSSLEFDVRVLEGEMTGKTFTVDKWCFDLANKTFDEEFRSIMFQR